MVIQKLTLYKTICQKVVNSTLNSTNYIIYGEKTITDNLLLKLHYNFLQNHIDLVIKISLIY